MATLHRLLRHLLLPQRLLAPSLLIWLLLLSASAAAASGHAATAEVEQLVELFPSDVPITMMDRITSDEAKKAKKTVQTKETFQLLTNLGAINGLLENTESPPYTNTHLHAFRGIPYARAPVGNLRFTDTVDLVGKWPSGYLNATKFRPFCAQYDVETKKVQGAEDCLFLNVYTPSHLDSRDRASKDLLPVFVFFHGGGFIRGSSSSHGAGKILSRDAVVVTVNYRLGILGFISTGDSILPGNYGMLDQVSALRWVQRNIAQFGGNPSQVTIGGFSAGSDSVNLHMVSPLSENLFHRGIMMSGSAQCNWGIRGNPLHPATLAAQELGCPTATSEDIMTCFVSRSFEEIVTAQAAIYRYEFTPIWFAPVVDGGLRSKPFIPAPLDELTIRPTPSIIGTVPDEGLFFSVAAILGAKNPRNVTSVYEEAARWLLTTWESPVSEEPMLDLAESFYYDDHSKVHGGLLLERMSEVVTDAHFTACMWDGVSNIAETGAPVYTYILTHRDPETTTWASPMYDMVRSLGYETPLLQTGVSHGDDLIYLFSFPYGKVKDYGRDIRVGQILLQMLTNFIITGEPQEGMDRFSLGDIPKWEQVKPNQPIGYYSIAADPAMVHTPFKLKEQNFWKKFIPLPDHPVPSRAKEILHVRDASAAGAGCRSNSASLSGQVHQESCPRL